MELSRRGFLALMSAAPLAACSTEKPALGAPSLETLEYPFHNGQHQAGIITPAQENLYFAAFDIDDKTTREEVAELLQDWSYAAHRLMMGEAVAAEGPFNGSPYAPPADTGEAADHGPFGLTITFGFGASIFDSRFGLKDQKPKEFEPLPTMVNDFIDPKISGGDLCIQACANDPQVAMHAVRNLTRIAMGRASLRWSQVGFGRTSSTTKDQSTPRNLFGQKDGTNNLKAEDSELLDTHVWINDGPEWARGGTYLVARKIYMTIEVWDGLRLEEQDRVLGRAKGTGAPLSGGDEFTEPDFSSGKIDTRSHVYRAHPDNNDGIQMLRRGYNYADGSNEFGRLDAGLFFIAFVSSPSRFAKVHSNLARDDMFVEYLKTQSSSTFIVPPGTNEGEYVGQKLFG